jgi:hypothetical protein
MTIREKLAVSGQQSCSHQAYHLSAADGENSVALIAAQCDLDLTIACPPECDLGADAMAEIKRVQNQRQPDDHRVTIAKRARRSRCMPKAQGSKSFSAGLKKHQASTVDRQRLVHHCLPVGEMWL